MADKNTYVKINDRYRLVYDSLCMWIEECTLETKKGTAKKQPWKRVSGYYSTISTLMQSFERYKFLQIEEVQTLEELAKAQEQLYAEIRGMCKELKTVSQLSK